MTWSDIARIFAQIELELIQSLRRNLERHKAWERQEGFNWSSWQAEKLRHIGEYRKHNRSIMDTHRPVIDAETLAMMEEQYTEGEQLEERDYLQETVTPGRDGFFGVNDRRVDSLAKDMLTLEHRVEQAALRTMDDVYRSVLYKAELAMAAGATTLPKAIDMATKEFLSKGINCIEYKDGRRVNIADYAQMALRTAAIRSYLQGEGKRRHELGIDTVLVSQYGACSETCLPWQGRVYIDDVWGGFDGETDGTRGKSRKGNWYPLLSTAIGGGLFHPNCRHTLSTWIEGVSSKPALMDGDKIRKAAKLEAKQRQMEREVRKWKRLAEGSVNPQNQVMYSQRVKQAQKELRGFIGEHSDELRRDYWREKVYTGNELHDVGTKPIPITQAAIDAVGRVDSEYIPASVLQEWHRDLLREAQKYPLDTEVMRSYAMDGRLLLQREGDSGGVSIRQFNEPFFVMHNHPDTNPFSIADLKAMTLPHLQGLSAVGNNGKVYLLEKTLEFDNAIFLTACEDWEDNFKFKPQTPDSAVHELKKFLKGVGQYGLKFVSTVP